MTDYHDFNGISLSRCACCPRSCQADRLHDKRGYCGSGSLAEIFRYGPHYGEEPPISGNRGSGTVFFSRCTMRCIYCQNYPWSQEGKGEEYGAKELAGIFENLRGKGCHNWNLVSPTPWIPQIREALNMVDGKKLPVVYNTSGYERKKVIRDCSDMVDVFLFDLRYSRNETAKEASDTDNYADFARSALKEAWDIKGPLSLDGNGAAISGVICRILVLPGHSDEAVENIRWLNETLGKKVSISIMSQYVPCHKALDSEPWNRPISMEEYREAVETARSCGFEGGWIQEYGKSVSLDLVGYRMRPDGS